jgi:hypothetical protein
MLGDGPLRCGREGLSSIRWFLVVRHCECSSPRLRCQPRTLLTSTGGWASFVVGARDCRFAAGVSPLVFAGVRPHCVFAMDWAAGSSTSCVVLAGSDMAFIFVLARWTSSPRTRWIVTSQMILRRPSPWEFISTSLCRGLDSVLFIAYVYTLILWTFLHMNWHEQLQTRWTVIMHLYTFIYHIICSLFNMFVCVRVRM